MVDLHGRTVVVLEARRAPELANLITRHGGRPISAPALREVPLPPNQEVADFIDAVCAQHVNIIIFLTGVGAKALIDAAQQQGKHEALLHALRRITVVCRGPKPVAVMKANSIPIALTAPEPNTWQDVVGAMRTQNWDLHGKQIAVQLYGAKNMPLREALESMGGLVREVSLYQWALPEDTGPLEAGIRLLADGAADAVIFTTQTQVHNMIKVAEQIGLKDKLKEALCQGIVVAPVGPICKQALEDEGIPAHVMPEHGKMGHLILALADYFEQRDAAASGAKR